MDGRRQGSHRLWPRRGCCRARGRRVDGRCQGSHRLWPRRGCCRARGRRVDGRCQGSHRLWPRWLLSSRGRRVDGRCQGSHRLWPRRGWSRPMLAASRQPSAFSRSSATVATSSIAILCATRATSAWKRLGAPCCAYARRMTSARRRSQHHDKDRRRLRSAGRLVRQVGEIDTQPCGDLTEPRESSQRVCSPSAS